ncbi:MAG: hypothetical protein Q4B09_05645 [Lachnospiraceae bacterium]|nr:hypothetical protein [Lachnospiraceae bacterium]
MAFENGEWIMKGLDWDDPTRIRSWKELISYVNEVGFLPLFANDVPGFSAEEHISPLFWWTGDPEQDPWEWREIIARSGEIVYGKFIGQKAVFISKEWFPVFANYRRDGYDFDARWDDELAELRQKKIMDRFDEKNEWIGADLKKEAGFGKNGEKNFSGVLSELQMQTYLVIKEFRRKVNKRGAEYGMPVCVYARPEELWGREMVTSAYKEDPKQSAERIREHLRTLWPEMTEKQLKKILR